ncbi:amphi-Trp domain-containing protein [Natronolimnohabitans innermongolicus]|uniref:Amphi-Trp domain-containing protein n=1 Tax=Natronolimnohabitans innermongolicus JCM 12255 TaxID=1227499 RepID=L9XKL3_9EURY|nr:amphi-Trp domain-containing protein [Natronolimnohabitans innermongolicus]ELY62285.1 hypothetical protein C493_00625 [Natronolimnohabitans innermongolicus JCM 12255]
MAETTENETEVPRDQAADLLQAVAQEIRGDGTAEIQVGNKLLSLSPAHELEYGIEVQERSPMLGGEREEMTITLEWEVEEAEADPDP